MVDSLLSTINHKVRNIKINLKYYSVINLKIISIESRIQNPKSSPPLPQPHKPSSPHQSHPKTPDVSS